MGTGVHRWVHVFESACLLTKERSPPEGDVHFTTVGETVSIVTKVIQKAGTTFACLRGVLGTVAREGQGSLADLATCRSSDGDPEELAGARECDSRPNRSSHRGHIRRCGVVHL